MGSRQTHIVRVVSLLLMLGMLAWTLRFVFAGVGNVMDPPYWLHKYMYAEGGWMASGTILLGHLHTLLWGGELLSFRLLSWACVVVAIALPYCLLLNSEQRQANVHWLAVAYALMNYGAFQEFSPGTLTVLCLSALWCMFVRFQRTNCQGWLVASGVLTGVAIAIRFPNILVLPLVLCALCREKDSPWSARLRPLVVYILSSLVGAGVMYGAAWVVLTPAYMDAAMGSHHLTTMIAQLWEKGAQLLESVLLWGGLLLGARVLRDNLPQPWQQKGMVLAGIVAGAITIYYVTYVPKVHQWYNFDVTYMVSALCVVVALLARQKELAWGTLLLSVATLGTDTAWLKLFPVVLCLLPMAGVQYKASMRAYMWVTAMLFAVAVMVRFSLNSVGNCNMRISQTEATVSPYTYIKVTEKEALWLEQVMADYHTYADSAKVLAVGQRMHMVRAMTGCEAAVYNEFWSNIFDPVYTAKYKDYIVAERPVVFCTFAPNFKTKPTYKDTQSALENMLREEGYREIDRSEYKYIIYIPTDD